MKNTKYSKNWALFGKKSTWNTCYSVRNERPKTIHCTKARLVLSRWTKKQNYIPPTRKPYFRTDVFLYRLEIVNYCYLLCDNMKNMVFRIYGHCYSPIFFFNSMQEVFFCRAFYFISSINLKDPDLFNCIWSVMKELNKINNGLAVYAWENLCMQNSSGVGTAISIVSKFWMTPLDPMTKWSERR